MTLVFDQNELYKIFETLQHDNEGYVNKKDFMAKAAELHHCAVLTVRNFINKRPDLFDALHGRIRIKFLEPMPNKVDDIKNYEIWLAQRNKIIDECGAFLAVQIPNPYIESVLTQLASARENLKSYSDSKLLSILSDLQRDYSFTPQTELSEVV